MLALGGVTALPASADAPAPDVYRQAVLDAYDQVKVPAPSDAARRQAITALESGTGKAARDWPSFHAITRELTETEQ